MRYNSENLFIVYLFARSNISVCQCKSVHVCVCASEVKNIDALLVVQAITQGVHFVYDIYIEQRLFEVQLPIIQVEKEYALA